MSGRRKWIVLALIGGCGLCLERWGNWWLFQYRPMTSRWGRTASVSFPQVQSPLPAGFAMGQEPGNAADDYLRAADMVQSEAVQAYETLWSNWGVMREVSKLSPPSWEAFQAKPDSPALAVLTAGMQKSQCDLPASLQAFVPFQRDPILSLAYVAQAALAASRQSEDKVASCLNLVRFGEHLRKAEPQTLPFLLGTSIERQAVLSLAETAPEADRKAWKDRAVALGDQSVQMRERATALRSNRALQMKVLVSEEPLGWKLSEGALPLAFSLKAKLDPKGFFWTWRSRSALNQFLASQSTHPLIKDFDPNQWDAEAWCEMRELMASPLFEGPSREVKRWEMERVR